MTCVLVPSTLLAPGAALSAAAQAPAASQAPTGPDGRLDRERILMLMVLITPRSEGAP